MFVKSFFESKSVAPVHIPKDNCKSKRPVVAFSISSRLYHGLLDSGSDLNILGNGSHVQFLKDGFVMEKSPFQSAFSANGMACMIIGRICLPVVVDGQTFSLNFDIAPSLTDHFIFGIEFWEVSGLLKKIEGLLTKFEPSENNHIGIVRGHPVNNSVNNSINCPVNSHVNNPVKNTCYLENSVKAKSVSKQRPLSLEQQKKLDEVVGKFNSISFEQKGLGRTHLVNYKIETTGEPIKQRFYRASPARQQIINEELDKLIKLGVLEESSSPWASPVILVQKASGGFRLCIDSRKLNAVTKKNSYPLPRVDDILDNMKNAKFISSIDLSQAFLQLPLSECSKEKTAIITQGRGLLQYTVVPFGLSNAPQTLQKLVDTLFGAEFYARLFAYLDDLIVINDNFDSHVKLLDKVYEKLKAANLTVNMSKCEFCKSELKYLGYIVSENGLATDPSKVDAINNFPTPKNVKEVRSFLGLASYYRRFINNFSAIARPLSQLTSPKSKFSWSSEAEEAFIELKKALTSSPVLVVPDFSEPFYLHADASGFGLGSSLVQKDKDGNEHPIAYFSRTLTKAETAYSTTERELLCVVESVKHFRHYIEGTHFTVVTDHESLKWLWKIENPTGRLARWATRLSQFDFDVVHKKGKFHVVPDALSRVNISAVAASVISNDQWYQKTLSGVQSRPERYPNFKLIDGELFRHCKPKFNLMGSYVWKKVIPMELRDNLIKNAHEDPLNAHLGAFKVYKMLSLSYYWPNMLKSISDILSKCDTCKAYKVRTSAPAGKMLCQKKVTAPMQVLSIDLVGPLPKSYSGHIYLLTIVDIFSKFVWLHPLKQATSKTIVKFLEENVFLKYGVPHCIVSDNGSQFISKEFETLLKKYNVPKVFRNCVYFPQNNTIERYNRTIETAIASYCGSNHRDWTKNLVKVQTALNSHVSAVHGFTPFFVMHGREHILDGRFHNLKDYSEVVDIDSSDLASYTTNLKELSLVFDEIQQHLLGAYQKNADRYNLRRRTVHYKEGDIVWRRAHFQSDAAKFFSNKLAPRFIKSIVLKVKSLNTYQLGNLDKTPVGIYHVSDIFKN